MSHPDDRASLVAMPRTERHFGMDVIRASAIACVIIGHAPIFFHQHYDLSGLFFLAMFGVELFFVLSGFLIGHILIDLVSEELSARRVWVFWLKRWFRTLPAYLFVAIAMMLIQRKFSWTHFLFIQNWFPEQLQRFPASWSLAIEEWFYLSFPISLLVIQSIGRMFGRRSSRWLIPVGCGGFILASWVLRGVASLHDGTWDLDVRKQIFLRLDAIAYGVLLAWWHERNPAYFTRNGTGFALAAASISGLLVCWGYYHQQIGMFGTSPNLLNSVVFFPLVTLVCVGTTAFHIRFARYPSQRWARMVLFTSVTSYSLYLVHLQLFMLASGRVTSAISAWLWFLFAISAMVLLSWALHRVIERPFMLMRQRFDPGERVTTHLLARNGGSGQITPG